VSSGSESEIDLDLSRFTYELASIVRSIGPKGVWEGLYNDKTLMRLSILDSEGASFSGTIEYPDDRDETLITGSVVENCDPNDELWRRLDRRVQGISDFAVSFKETRYKRKGKGDVDLKGEYGAVIKGDQMSGNWFGGEPFQKRGSLYLKRTGAPSQEGGIASG
jgi:hypothetical protein